MPRGSFNDARRRNVGKSASQDEMIWIGCSYGGTGCFEIALPHQPGKRIAAGKKVCARSIGVIGSMLLVCVALINRTSSIGWLDPLQRIQRLPRLHRRAPDRVEISENRDSTRAATRERPCDPGVVRSNPRNKVSNSSGPRQSGPQRNSLSMNQPRMLMVIGSLKHMLRALDSRT